MKKMSSLILFCLFAISFLPAFAGEIPVGIYGTLTGTDTDVNGMSYGPRDYLTYVNEKFGGVMGHKYVPILLDGKNQIPEEVKVFKRLVDVDNVVVVNGWSTGGTKALRDQINTLIKVPFQGQSLIKDVLDPEKYPFIFLLGAHLRGPGDHRYELGQTEGGQDVRLPPCGRRIWKRAGAQCN